MEKKYFTTAVVGFGIGAMTLLFEPGCSPVSANQKVNPPNIPPAAAIESAQLTPIDVIPERNPYIPDFIVDSKLDAGLEISHINSHDRQKRANEIFAGKLATQIRALTLQFTDEERQNMKFDVWGVDSQYGYTVRLTTKDESKSYIYVDLEHDSIGVWIKVPEGAKLATENLAKIPNTLLEKDIYQPIYTVNGISFGDNGVLELSSVPQDHKSDYNKAVINYELAIDASLRFHVVTQALNQPDTKDATYTLIVYYDPKSDTCTGILTQYLQTGIKRYSVDSKGKIRLIDFQPKKSGTLFARDRLTSLNKPKQPHKYHRMALSTNSQTSVAVKRLPLVI